MKLKMYLAGIAVYLAAIAAFAVPMLPHDALAIENYYGSVVAQCTTTNGVTTNVTATIAAASPNWDITTLTYTFMPGSIVKSGASGSDPSNPAKLAHFSVPPGTYTVTVTNPGLQGTYTITAMDCSPKRSSLSVQKTVVNTTSIPTGTTVFPVDVTCNHGAINTTLNLSNAGGLQQSVMNIAVGSICQIQEHPIPAPPGCHWNTTYPHGQSIRIAGFAGYLLPVRNELVCKSKCPEGTTEQTYPGTNIKFCCKGKLDPRSESFCCTRERIPFTRDGDEKMTPAPDLPKQQE